jgi:hypothetical protein
MGKLSDKKSAHKVENMPQSTPTDICTCESKHILNIHINSHTNICIYMSRKISI